MVVQSMKELIMNVEISIFQNIYMYIPYSKLKGAIQMTKYTCI